MKTYNKTFLPESLRVNEVELRMNSSLTGKILTGVNVKTIALELKSQGKKCALVLVLPKSMKNKIDAPWGGIPPNEMDILKLKK